MEGQSKCPTRELVTENEVSVLVNKQDKDRVICSLRTLIADCFKIKCPEWEKCQFQEDVAYVLLQQKIECNHTNSLDWKAEDVK